MTTATVEESATSKLCRVYSQDGFQEMPFWQAQDAVRSSGGKLRHEPFPDIGWEKEVPRYRATMDVRPAKSDRLKHEPPVTYCSDPAEWQHGERQMNAGDEIETTTWPHRSFQGINTSARHVLDLIQNRSGYVLPKTPWQDGQVIARR